MLLHACNKYTCSLLVVHFGGSSDPSPSAPQSNPIKKLVGGRQQAEPCLASFATQEGGCSTGKHW